MDTAGPTSAVRTGQLDAGKARVLIEAGMRLAAEVSLPILLRRLVELAVGITDAQYGALGVLGPLGAFADFITVGMDEDARAAIGELPTGQGLLRAVLDEDRPLRLRSIAGDPRCVGFPAHHPPMTSFLGVPIRARGRVFGSLYLTNKSHGLPFDTADEAAVATLASQGGIAIANWEARNQLEKQRAWLLAQQEVTTALLAGEPAQRMLDTIAESARRLGEADLAAISLPQSEDSLVLEVVAAAGIGADVLLNGPSRGSGTISHLVFEDGLTMTVAEGDPLLQSTILAAAGIPLTALLIVPLWLTGRVSGTISLAHAVPGRRFGAEELEVLTSFAAQAALTLDYSRMQARSLKRALEDERRRISRDLHDDPVQALIVLARRLETLSLQPGTLADWVSELESSREMVTSIVGGLREVAEGLRDDAAEQESLAEALRGIARRFSSRTGIAVSVSERGQRRRWGHTVEVALLRIAHECLTNVERHARAKRVTIVLAHRREDLSLRISDDGAGFRSSGRGMPRPGLGTIGMSERAELLGGRLLVSSRPGQGTVVQVSIPVGSEGSDQVPSGA